MKRDNEWVLEQDYNGCVLTTDGVSFFAKDKNNKVVAEAKSMDAVKHKILKPKKLDIDAVILEDRWSYRNEDFEPERVHIYAVSGAGAILYQKADGSKDKGAWKLRRYDANKLARFRELKQTERDTKKALEALLESWPELDAQELRKEGQEAAAES